MPLLALFALLPACTAGLDFDGLSRDFAKDCASGVGPNCEDVASSLAGLRVELPCKGDSTPSYTCVSDPADQKAATLRGNVGTTYLLKLHVRGIVEMAAYSGATAGSPFPTGGTNTSGAYNTYTLVVNDPPQTYDLNAGTPQTYTEPVDVTTMVAANALTTVTLTANAQDSRTIKNAGANMQPVPTPTGIVLAENPYSGQFMQVDVVSVAIAPP
jgi:hypothetical protein